MYTIDDNGIIVLNRGDTFTQTFPINIGSSAYPVYPTINKETDKVYFGLTEPNQYFECALVRKVLDISVSDNIPNAILEFEIKDTEYLLPGNYYYEIKLYRNRNNKEEITTIYPKTKFIIVE